MRYVSLAATALILGAFSTPARAQSFEFTADQANSNYTWNGTTSLGPLLGNPSNAFQVSGTLDVGLDTGGNPVGSAEWISADLLIVPDLAGYIPNPIHPALPPLALVDVAGMRFSISSASFSVDGAGNFSTSTSLEIISGTLTVTPITGAQTVTDLTGIVGPATPTSGTITQSGSDIDFVSPMNTMFAFTDPGSGIDATVNLIGTLTAHYTCQAAVNYCPVTPNSAGSGAVMATSGSTFMTTNNFVLSASGAPANKPGIFFVGPNQVQLPLGNGIRCVGGAIKRLGVKISSGAGVFTQALDFNNLPNGTVIDPGYSKYFQCWFRDTAAGGANQNLSDGVCVVFCP